MSKREMLNLTNDKISLVYLNTLGDPKVMFVAKQQKIYLINGVPSSVQYIKALNNLVNRRTGLLDRKGSKTLTEYNEQATEPLKVLTVIVDDAEICKRNKQLVEVLSTIQEYSVRVGIAIVMNSPKGYIPEFKTVGNTLVTYGSNYQLNEVNGHIEKEVGGSPC